MPLLQPTATYYGGDVANDNYYLRKGQAIPSGQPLVAPVNIKSEDSLTTATISVDDNSVPSYLGAIGLNSGSNASGPSLNVLTGRTTAATQMNLEIGNNLQTNVLQIAGLQGLSQVNDPIYNPVMPTQLVNLIGPNVSPNYPNGWLLNDPSGQVVTSFQGGPAQSFNVPKSGLYMLQATILMAPATTSTGGTDAGGFSLQITVNNANSPFPSVGGVVIGQPTPLSSSGPQRSYYSWNSYIPLASGVLYALTVQMLDGAGVTLPPNLINNVPYSDLQIQLIKIG
jgi:hypothetical protein